MRHCTILACILLGLALAPGDALAKGKPENPGKPEHAGGPQGNGADGKDHGNAGGPKGKPKVLREVKLEGGGPPPWAPAHGYRRKQGDDGGYVVPFGFDRGTCERNVLAEAVGAAHGPDPSGSATRAIVGVLADAVLDTILGPSGDRIDRDCFGQALEHTPSNRVVRWRDPDGTAYEFSSVRSFETDGERYCRDYATIVTRDGLERTRQGTACRDADGTWR